LDLLSNWNNLERICSHPLRNHWKKNFKSIEEHTHQFWSRLFWCLTSQIITSPNLPSFVPNHLIYCTWHVQSYRPKNSKSLVVVTRCSILSVTLYRYHCINPCIYWSIDGVEDECWISPACLINWIQAY